MTAGTRTRVNRPSAIPGRKPGGPAMSRAVTGECEVMDFRPQKQRRE